MTLAVWFWLLYVLSLIFVGWGEWGIAIPGNPFARRGWYIILYILIGLLGWKAFGSPIQ
jgi:hypothetical protein